MADDTYGMTRRELLVGAAAGLALGLPGLPHSADAAGEPDLAVISGDPAAATRKALETLGGMSRFVQKGQRVVLKPNMSFASGPDRGANTHPGVVLTVTGPSQRYCARELAYQGILASDIMTTRVSGGEFVAVLGRADAYKKTGEVPEILRTAREGQ